MSTLLSPEGTTVVSGADVSGVVVGLSPGMAWPRIPRHRWWPFGVAGGGGLVWGGSGCGLVVG